MAETDVIPTKSCKNCKQDIPGQNFQMHEIHCWRNIALCKSCREPVPKSKMEEHNEEYHALVECTCKQKIEKSCLELHEKEECPHRMVQCRYCEIDLKFVSFFEHENACGSKTEKCEKCGNYIMLRAADTHDCSSEAFKDQSNTRNRNHFEDRIDDFPYEFLDDSFVRGVQFGASRDPVVPDYVSNFLGHSEVFGESSHMDESTRAKPSNTDRQTEENTDSAGNEAFSERSDEAKPRPAVRKSKRIGKRASVKESGHQESGIGDHVADDLQELKLDGRNGTKKIPDADEKQKRTRGGASRNNRNTTEKRAHPVNKKSLERDRSNLEISGRGIATNSTAARSGAANRFMQGGETVSDSVNTRDRITRAPRGPVTRGRAKGLARTTERHSFATRGREPASSSSRDCSDDEPTNVESDHKESVVSRTDRHASPFDIDATRHRQEDEDLETQNFELPCEICEASIPINALEAHQESCLLSQQELLRAFKDDNPNVQRPFRNPSPELQRPKIEEIIVDDDKHESEGEPATIPCEFCQQQFPLENFILHQPYCEMNPLRHQATNQMDTPIVDNDTPPRKSNLPPGYWESKLVPSEDMMAEAEAVINSRFQEMNQEGNRELRNSSGSHSMFWNAGVGSSRPRRSGYGQNADTDEDEAMIDEDERGFHQRFWPHGGRS